jgi:hypothetical protein
MSDPNERRPGTTAGPAPAPPPGGAAARRDALVGHFRQHQDRYTRHALDQGARTAGYSDNDVAAAWTLIDMEDGGKAPAARFAPLAQVVVVALYIATFVLFVAGSDMSARTYGVGVAILAVTLLVVGGISLLIVSRSKIVSRNPLAALASLLAVPFIFLVVVAGLCVVTTGPAFFGGQGYAGPTPAPEPAFSDAPAVAP